MSIKMRFSIIVEAEDPFDEMFEALKSMDEEDDTGIRWEIEWTQTIEPTPPSLTEIDPKPSSTKELAE